MKTISALCSLKIYLIALIFALELMPLKFQVKYLIFTALLELYATFQFDSKQANSLITSSSISMPNLLPNANAFLAFLDKISQCWTKSDSDNDLPESSEGSQHLEFFFSLRIAISLFLFFLYCLVLDLNHRSIAFPPLPL
ncbi:hypothetical protein GQ457_01G024200 [Hibiscus cannabinus]